MLLASRDIPVEVHGNGRFVLPDRDFTPAYLRTYEERRLREKVEEALEALRDCTVCPRNCHVDRLANRFAVCRVGRYARVSSFFPHFGEEDVLRGWAGSGTIFFAWCNLRCVFCLAPETRVWTDAGPQSLEDLFEKANTGVRIDGGEVRFLSGYSVYTRGGVPAPAVKIFCHQHRGELVVVKPYGLPALRATPEHSLFVADRPGHARKVPASEIRPGQWLFVPVPAPVGRAVRLEAPRLLAGQGGEVRARPRRVPLDVLVPLAYAAARGETTTEEVAERLGYHPAYARRLSPRARRGELVEPAPAANLLVVDGERVKFRTEKGSGVPRERLVDEDLAWLFGMYCAEGQVTAIASRPNSYRVVFSFGRAERALAETTAEKLRRVFEVESRIVERRTTVTVEVGSASLGVLFKSLAGSGARNKRVPAFLFQSPASVVRAFLEAYWEGDGCWQGSYRVATTVSLALALGLVALLLQLGVFPYFYATPRPPDASIQGRRVGQQPVLYLVKCRWNANDGSGARRCYVQGEGGFWVRVRRVWREAYDGPVFNLEVGHPDHSYVAHGVAVGNCQNYETSQIGEGVDVGPRELAAMMLRLQELGCHNINFVTPEHVVPQILEALPYAIEGGLRLPLVYNTSSYDSLHSIRLMDGVVDVYMPDFKLWNREHARKYLLAPDYPEVARQVIRAMHEQVGVLKVNEDGLARRGVLVRHLVMPGLLDDTREILRWLAELSPDTYVNVMDQYRPAWKARAEAKYAEINRPITSREYQQAVAYAREAGLWRLDGRWRRGPYLVLW